jgi:hypothetical protein
MLNGETMLPRFRIANAYAIALLAPLLLPLVACGNGRSENLGDSDSGVAPPHPTPHDDAGDDGGCGSSIFNGTSTSCTDPCGNPIPPTCFGGEWQCPDDSDPGEISCSPPEDAGPEGGGCTGIFVCDQIPPCPEVWYEQVCVNDSWACQPVGTCGVEDSGPPPPPPDFSCGNLACDPSTSYCQITTGGAILEDGGTPTGFSCLPLPSTCSGIAASCECVESGQELAPACDCVSESGDVIVTCAVP